MKRSYSYTLAELADKLDASLKGNADRVITGLNTLQDAGELELAFLANPAYARFLETTRAGAVILSPASAESYQGDALILDNPYLGYARASHLFDVDRGLSAGVAPSAVISPDADVHEMAAIGENVVIESGVVVESGVRIDAGVVVGHDSVISKDAHICRNVTICHGVFIGQRTIIHPGAVIGGDGFGNAYADGRWHKIAQIGGVVVGDDVEIGASTCIDRGALGDTIIKNGARLDNLIQIAHNVVIGENTAIAANVGISGSTVVGKNCTIAGAAGLAGHITIADGVHLGGMAMVTKSVTKPGAYASGTGLMDAGEWRRNAVRFRKLDEMAKRIRLLEKR